MSTGKIATRRVSMTRKQAEMVLYELNTVKRLARLEGGSNRMQNTLDRVVVRIKRAIRLSEAQETGLF